MNWNPFKKTHKPVQDIPALQRDVHTLSGLSENPRFGRGADDYRTGWLWHCMCGQSATVDDWQLPRTESEARALHNLHRRSWGMENL